MIGGFELFRGLDQYRMLVFGVAMVLLMIWRPRGLIGHRAPTVFLKQAQAISSDLVEGRPRMSGDCILTVDHLSMRFGGIVAVNDLSFDAERRKITALIGPNGAGKTTVFNCITGFYKPTAGTMRITHETGAEIRLERLNDFRISKQAKVARTFQNIRLFPGMTALENLMVAQHNALMLASGLTFLGLIGAPSWRSAEKRAIDLARLWLDRIGLLDRADDAAGNLPYGDQRRLEIARAMCTEPALLCLDEPAAGLNATRKRRLERTAALDPRRPRHLDPADRA